MKIIIAEKKIRDVIKKILSEQPDSKFDRWAKAASDYRASNPSKVPPPQASEHLVEKKFSLVEDGEPDFVVIADSPTVYKKSIIVAYSQTTKSIKEIADKLVGGEVILPRSRYESFYGESISDIVSSAIERDDGWKVSETAIQRLDRQFNSSDRTNFTDYAMIDYVAGNFKKARVASSAYAIDAAARGECVLNFDEVVRYVFNKPLNSPEWAMAAACFYSYSNSMAISAVAATVGGIVGSLATPAGAPAGAIAVMTGTDFVLKLPVLLWSAYNGRWAFFGANCLYIAVGIAGLKMEAAIAKNPASVSAIKRAAYWIIEFVLQLAPDIVAYRERAKQAIDDALEKTDQMDSELKRSSDEIKNLLRTKYPVF